MEKININRVVISHSKHGIKSVSKWDSLEAFNNHMAAISKQKDWQMYFPMEAVINFKNSDGTFKNLKLIRISKPAEITL